LGQINTCRIIFTLPQRKSASKSKKAGRHPARMPDGFQQNRFLTLILPSGLL
jgi:hypothetical protein